MDIRIKNLSYERDGFHVEVPSLEIEEGSFTFIMGLNGSGKTTFLNLIARLLKPQNGHISINGRAVDQLSQLEVAEQIALVEQETSYIFPYTVLEVVLMGRFVHYQGSLFERSSDIAIAFNAMKSMQVEHLADKPVKNLSGGERRRVEIARAIAQESNIILFDEPTSFLDIKQQDFFTSLLFKLHKNEKKTIICVTHKTELVKKYAGRVVIFDKGRIVADLPNSKNLTEDKFLSCVGA